MNDYQTKGLLRILEKLNSKPSLLLFRKMLLLFGLLLIITACVELYTNQFVLSLSMLGEFVAAGLMFNYAQRIELQLLKKKINDWLVSQSMNIVDSRE